MTQTQCIKHNTLIARELLSFAIASCKVISKPLLSAKLPLLHTKSRRMSRVFYCLFLTVFTLIFVSCTTDEDPVHEVMRGYFDESQGLFCRIPTVFHAFHTR